MQLTMVVLLAAPLLAQGRAGDADAPWCPLAKGARWQYRVQTGDQVQQRSCVDEGEVDLPDGHRGHQLRVTTGDAVEFEYWSARADGVFVYTARLSMQGAPRRGVEDMPPSCWLRTPLGVERRWRFALPFLGQISVGPGEEVGEWPQIEHEVEVVSPGEQVQVPAGSFAAARVRERWRMRGGGDAVPWSSRELWFARGVGLVKRVEHGSDGAVQETVELAQFAAGAPDPEPLPVLRRWLAGDPAWSQRPDCKVEPLALGNASCWLFGRVYSVAGQGARAFVHVRGDVAVPVASDDAAGWQSLLAAHGLRADDDELLGAVASAVARIGCAGRSLPAPALIWPSVQRVREADGSERSVAHVHGDVVVDGKVRGRAYASATCARGDAPRLVAVATGVRDPVRK